MIRQSRIITTTSGQFSPLELNKDIQNILNKLNLNNNSIICDVGCGIGKQVELLRHTIKCNYYGLDFSPATIEYLKDTNIFDKVYLCSSDILPLPDKMCDVAISMENLEHLYEEPVLNAIKELLRISNYVIITTPRPDICMFMKWINKELDEAINDMIPLSEHDYICLESCVHKSTIYPNSMNKCGFDMYWNGISMIYHGKSSEINLDFLEYTGINKQQHYAKYSTLKDRYVNLLKECKNINDEILYKFSCTPFKI